MASSDKTLGMGCPIARREFLGGVALTAAAAAAPKHLLAQNASEAADYYPPSLTGMRGSHDGSFETAHSASLDGEEFSWPADQTDDNYDLIVVGGGISGLAAARFYQQQAGSDARILILENHDDFGGHARRNEFQVGGRTIIGYGGSQSFENPGRYSKVTKRLLKDLAVDVDKFYSAYDQELYDFLGLGLYFDRETYGVDKVVTVLQASPFDRLGNPESSFDWIDQTPLSEETKRSLWKVYVSKEDYLGQFSARQKIEKLLSMSYNDYLRKFIGVTEEGISLFQKRTHGYWGYGTDAVTALDAAMFEMPGFQGLGVEKEIGAMANEELSIFSAEPDEDSEPYIFHFPDGNASVARLLVRKLIPGVAPGSTMEDIVIARFDYSRLDEVTSSVRLRLNSTVVQVRHETAPGKGALDIMYMRDGQAHRVRAKQCVLACYNSLIPYMCPELPQEQKVGLAYNVKMPLVYSHVLINSWQPFVDLGLQFVQSPGRWHSALSLDFPVSLGSYRFSSDPSEPMMLHMTYVPTRPNEGLALRDQFRAARYDLLETTFEQFEREIRTHLAGMLSTTGFDPARDIEAITVNRWAHGYAYDYNALFDPQWPEGKAPHEIGRKTFGNIAIANSDAGADAYANVAIDQAHRAVQDLVS